MDGKAAAALVDSHFLQCLKVMGDVGLFEVGESRGLIFPNNRLHSAPTNSAGPVSRNVLGDCVAENRG